MIKDLIDKRIKYLKDNLKEDQNIKVFDESLNTLNCIKDYLLYEPLVSVDNNGYIILEYNNTTNYKVFIIELLPKPNIVITDGSGTTNIHLNDNQSLLNKLCFYKMAKNKGSSSLEFYYKQKMIDYIQNKDHDWDYGYLLEMIEMKLTSMGMTMWNGSYTESRKTAHTIWYSRFLLRKAKESEDIKDMKKFFNYMANSILSWWD